MREEEVQAYRKAVEANPKNDQAWTNLSSALGGLYHETKRGTVLREMLAAAESAASLSGRRYNLACALALNGRIDKALEELEACIRGHGIDRQHVLGDRDWKHLHKDARFRKLVTDSGHEAGAPDSVR